MMNFCGGRTSKILPWYPMHASACMGMPGYAWACPFGYLFGLSFVFLNWFSKSLMIFTFLNVMKLTGHARACLGIYRHARACPFGYLFGPSFVFVNWFSKSQMIFTFLNDMKLKCEMCDHKANKRDHLKLLFSSLWNSDDDCSAAFRQQCRMFKLSNHKYFILVIVFHPVFWRVMKTRHLLLLTADKVAIAMLVSCQLMIS